MEKTNKKKFHNKIEKMSKKNNVSLKDKDAFSRINYFISFMLELYEALNVISDNKKIKVNHTYEILNIGLHGLLIELDSLIFKLFGKPRPDVLKEIKKIRDFLAHPYQPTAFKKVARKDGIKYEKIIEPLRYLKNYFKKKYPKDIPLKTDWEEKRDRQDEINRLVRFITGINPKLLEYFQEKQSGSPLNINEMNIDDFFDACKNEKDIDTDFLRVTLENLNYNLLKGHKLTQLACDLHPSKKSLTYSFYETLIKLEKTGKYGQIEDLHVRGVIKNFAKKLGN